MRLILLIILPLVSCQGQPSFSLECVLLIPFLCFLHILAALLLIVYTSLDRNAISCMPAFPQKQLLLQIEQSHTLLVIVLLLLSGGTALSLPFLLQSIYPFLIAYPSSIVLLVGCEVAPRMLLSQHRNIQIAGIFAPIVSVLYCCSLCRLISQLIGRIFNKKQNTIAFNRENIRELLHLHQQRPYRSQEIEMLQKILSLKHQGVRTVAVKWTNIFKVSLDAQINAKFYKNISKYSFSKVLIYEGVSENIIGYVPIKRLITCSPSQHETIRSKCEQLLHTQLAIVSVQTSILDAVAEMTEKKMSFAIIKEGSEAVGLIRLKDIFKGLVLSWYNYDSLQPDKNLKALQVSVFGGKDHFIEAVEQP